MVRILQPATENILTASGGRRKGVADGGLILRVDDVFRTPSVQGSRCGSSERPCQARVSTPLSIIVGFSVTTSATCPSRPVKRLV
jgi:hypothetical protein